MHNQRTPEKSEAYEQAKARLDRQLLAQSPLLYLVNSYIDGDEGNYFEVREYGDSLDGRAFTIDLATGEIDETDR